MKDYSTTTKDYYNSTISNYSWNLSDFIGKEEKEEIIKKLLDGEDDLMPILKQYLAKYLDSIMENPESIIKELIEEKDDRINNLEKKVDELEKRLASIYLNQPTPLGNYPPYNPPYNPYLYNGYNSGEITATTGYTTTV